METILEQQRRYHEERERLVDAMVKEMLHKKISVNIAIIYLKAIQLISIYCFSIERL